MNIRWKIAQQLEAWWWKRYLAARPVENYLDWKRDYWATFLHKAGIEVPDSEKILDAGCGPAGIFMMFSGTKVTAVDPLWGKYQARFPHLQKQKFPGVKFMEMGLEQFCTENLFEKVFCLNAINHVANLELSIKNLCASVKERGTLFLSVDTHNNRFLKKLFRWVPADGLHPHQMDLDEYKTLLTGNGIRIEEVILLKKERVFSYYLITGIKTQ